MTASRRRRWLVAGLAALEGVLATAAQIGPGHVPTAQALGELVAGWSFVVAGLIALNRRPTSRVAWLTVAVGLAWFAPDIVDVNTSLTYTVGQLLQGSQWVVLMLMLALFRADGRRHVSSA